MARRQSPFQITVPISAGMRLSPRNIKTIFKQPLGETSTVGMKHASARLWSQIWSGKGHLRAWRLFLGLVYTAHLWFASSGTRGHAPALLMLPRADGWQFGSFQRPWMDPKCGMTWSRGIEKPFPPPKNSTRFSQSCPECGRCRPAGSETTPFWPQNPWKRILHAGSLGRLMTLESTARHHEGEKMEQDGFLWPLWDDSSTPDKLFFSTSDGARWQISCILKKQIGFEWGSGSLNEKGHRVDRIYFLFFKRDNLIHPALWRCSCVTKVSNHRVNERTN